MFDQLITLDKELLLLINGFHNHVLDGIMVFVSLKLGWIPLYIFLLYIIINDYRHRSWLVLIMIGLTVLIADQSSVHLFKNIFQRLRPCHDDALAELLYMVKPCGGKFGFISSHAANSFSIAIFISFLLENKHRWIWPVMLLYGVLIIYSRVYLGVHYPSDVIAGAAVGSLIGMGSYHLFKEINKYICRVIIRKKD